MIVTTMYILLLIISSLAIFNQKRSLCFSELPDLFKYTKKIVDICKKNESAVIYYFAKMPENKNNRTLFDSLSELIPHYETIKNSSIKIVPFEGGGYIVNMRMLCLRMWSDVIDLSMHNEYIINQINFKEQISDILKFLGLYVLTNPEYANETAYVEFHVISETDINRLLKNILYLFDFIISSRPDWDNRPNVQYLDTTGKKYKERKNEINDQITRSNNENQQQKNNSEVLLTDKPVTTANQSIHVQDSWTGSSISNGNGLQKNVDGLKENMSYFSENIRSNYNVQDNLPSGQYHNHMNLSQENDYCEKQNRQVFGGSQQINDSNEQTCHDHHVRTAKNTNKKSKKTKSANSDTEFFKKDDAYVEKIGGISVDQILLLCDIVFIVLLCICVLVIIIKISRTKN